MSKRIVDCLLFLIASATALSPAHGAIVITFNLNDFTHVDVFNDIQIMEFTIQLNETLAPGAFVNPQINQIDYRVFGVLTNATPSTFSAFNLVRNIVGNYFYTQGSSMNFAIAAGADLNNGLQVSDLVDNGIDPVFEFNAREVLTRRFHPPQLRLFGNGTGVLRNSNNVPNGSIGEIAFGAEYITNLRFNPAALTLAPVPVPEPGSSILISFAGLSLWLMRRRAG